MLGRKQDSFTFPLFTKNGKRIEVLLNMTTRMDVDGKVRSCLAWMYCSLMSTMTNLIP